MSDRVCWLALVVLCVSAPVVGAADAPLRLACEVRPHYEAWRSELLAYAHQRAGGYWDPEVVARTRLRFGPGADASLTGRYRALFLRGRAGLASSAFDDGAGRRRDLGVDLGVGGPFGVFVGYRDLRVTLPEGLGPALRSHGISDAVFGSFFRSRPGRPGAFVEVDFAIGITALPYLNSERIREKPEVAEGNFTLGLRGRSRPFTIALGYRAWTWEEPFRSYPASTLLTDRVLESWQDEGHGPVLHLEWDFGRWP